MPGFGAIFVQEETVIRYETMDITAVGGVDYAVTSGTLTINEDQTRARASIRVFHDDIDEPEETFVFYWETVRGPPPEGPQYIVIPITDLNPTPSLSVLGTEGEEGEREISVPVELDSPSGRRVTVDYASSDGTAIAGSDYDATSGTLTFEPGETRVNIELYTIIDAVAEPDETLTMTLTSPVNATLDQDVDTVTIKAHGTGAAVLSIGHTRGSENSGSLAFEVSLVGTATQDVEVEYATGDVTAVAGSDYVEASGTLTFPLGTTSRTITVALVNDEVDEPDETLLVRLENPSGASLGNPRGEGVIIDDDDPPMVSVSAATVEEGAVAGLPVELSVASQKTVAVRYRSVSDTALAGLDYRATAGLLTFAPGTTRLSATVSTLDDAVDEDDEAFTVELRLPDNATLGTSSAVATITDNDDTPTLAVDTDGGTEGTDVDFEVTLSGPSSKTISADYQTVEGTAQQGLDFRSESGTLTFSPGETAATVSVRIRQDRLDEDSETFGLEVSSEDLGQRVVVIVRIDDDDDPPTLTIGDASGSEGTNLDFSVDLGAPSGRTVTVDYETSDGTALAASDYEAVTGTMTFNPGTTTGTVSVRLLADELDEPDESLSLALTNPVAVILPDDPTALGTISDANDPPTLGLVPADGSEDAGELVFEVGLSQASAFEVTVDYATSDVSAQASFDYAATAGTLTIPAGDTTAEIRVPILDDTLDEADETVRLELSRPVNATFAADGGSLSVTGKIRDDDDPPGLTVADVSGTEGEVVEFVVALGAASGLAVSLDYQTSDATAVAGEDYAAAAGGLSFAPGETSATVSVRLRADGQDEADETFVLSLSSVVNAALDDDAATGTIIDDDAPPTLGAVGVAGAEGSVVEVVVELDAPSGRTVTVEYHTADGSATAGDDYEAASGELTFAPGATQASVAVRLLTDGLDEGEESFEVSLSSPSHATLATAVAVVRIVDIDGAPRLLVGGGSASEGGSLAFTVSMAGSTTQSVTVDYATEDGTAVAGLDFDAVSGTLTLAPGESRTTVNVPLVDDTIDEAAETFALVLSQPHNAEIATGRADGTILDTDDAPTLRVADAAGGEGSTAAFRVSLDGESAREVSVAFATTDGTAVADVDYEPTAGTLTFLPGEATKTVSVGLAADDVHESRETFALTLSLPTHATLDVASATGTIEDDDPQPTFDVAAASDTEGGTARFVVTLTGATAVEAVVDYATADDTAIAGADYEAAEGTLTFAPGVVRRAVAVALLQDNVDEPDETFRMILSSSLNATLGSATAEGRIVDDDGPPLAAVAGASGTEGERIEFSVTLTGAAAENATVEYATADVTAAAGEDYEPTTGVLTFEPGATSNVVPVQLLDDTLDEAEETFALILSTPSNAGIAAESAIGTIMDDDPPPTISVEDGSGVEGTTVEFVVRLSGPSGLAVSVFYETIGGTATPGADYEPVSGVLTLAPGATHASVVVRLPEDAAVEDRETFSLELSDPGNVVIATSSATGTILDDDSLVALTMAGAEVTEADGTVAFTVRLDSADHAGVTASHATSDGSAVAGVDYVAASGTLTFAVGEREKTIEVDVVDDVLDEDDETFTLELTDLAGATAELATAVATILDDDSAPGLMVADDTVPENAGEIVFAVTLDTASGRQVRVAYATADGTAQAGADYEETTGELMFAPGETDKAVAVPVIDDDDDEPDESLTLTLSDPHAATLARAAATGTIEDDDLDPPTAGTAPTLALCVGGALGQVDLGDLFSGEMLSYATASADSSVATASLEANTLVVAPVAEGTTRVSVTASNESGEASVAIGVLVTADPAELAALDASLAAAGRSLLADAVAAVADRFVDPAARSSNPTTASGKPVSASHPVPGSPAVGTGLPDRPSGSVVFGRVPAPIAEHGVFGTRAPPSFSFAGADPRAPGWSVWGRGGVRRFEARGDDASEVDGSLTSYRVGADTRFGDWILGLSAAWSSVDSEYRFQRSIDACGGGLGEGLLELELTSFAPFAGRGVGTGWLWGTAGVGQGEAVVKRCESGQLSDADLDVRHAAFGGRHPFVERERFSLSVMEDAGILKLSTGMSSGPVGERDVLVGRARLGLELAAGGPSAVGKSTTTAYLRALARQDWGDGITGGGLEVAAGLRYRNPTRRLGIDAGLGTLAVSATDDATEHRADVALSTLPRPDGTGLQAALSWRTGSNGFGLAAGGVSPWETTGSRQDWTAETRLGYGLANRRGIAIPFMELDVGGRATGDLRLGLEHRFDTDSGFLRLDWGIMLESGREGSGNGVFLNAIGEN